MAKIVLITSIPQDVFMASGATVKPSLVFFKKFTKIEETTYKRIKKIIIGRLKQKYADEITKQNDILESKEASKTEKKIAKTELKHICSRIEQESKPLIREHFNYQIPIAQIKKAGITTTGSKCENELTELLKEYSPYRIENKLWESSPKAYQYKIEGDKLYRKLNDEEWVEKC